MAEAKRWIDLTEGQQIASAEQFVAECFDAAGGARPPYKARREAALKIVKALNRTWKAHTDECRIGCPTRRPRG